jgi:hypothetical protein
VIYCQLDGDQSIYKIAKFFIDRWLTDFKSHPEHKKLIKYFDISATESMMPYFFNIFNTITFGRFASFVAT